MNLNPQQWICDTCGEIIESPSDGWLEWRYDGPRGAHDFRIVHHKSKSPHEDGCYQHEGPGRRGSPLDCYVGSDGLATLLSFLDFGNLHPQDRPQVVNKRELAELIRRLMLPHYEEARLYWPEAKQDDFFEGANEYWPYLQRTLTQVIEQYGPKERM
jgi:hypothetical protein